MSKEYTGRDPHDNGEIIVESEIVIILDGSCDDWVQTRDWPKVPTIRGNR